MEGKCSRHVSQDFVLIFGFYYFTVIVKYCKQKLSIHSKTS